MHACTDETEKRKFACPIWSCEVRRTSSSSSSLATEEKRTFMCVCTKNYNDNGSTLVYSGKRERQNRVCETINSQYNQYKQRTCMAFLLLRITATRVQSDGDIGTSQQDVIVLCGNHKIREAGHA